MRGQMERGQQGQESRLVSCPVVTWAKKATSWGGLGILVVVSISSATPCKAGQPPWVGSTRPRFYPGSG